MIDIFYIFGIVYMIRVFMRVNDSMRPSDPSDTVVFDESTTITSIARINQIIESQPKSILTRITSLIDYLGFIWLLIGYLYFPEKSSFLVGLCGIAIRWAIIWFMVILIAFSVFKNLRGLPVKNKPKTQINLPIHPITGALELVGICTALFIHYLAGKI